MIDSSSLNPATTFEINVSLMGLISGHVGDLRHVQTLPQFQIKLLHITQIA